MLEDQDVQRGNSSRKPPRLPGTNMPVTAGVPPARIYRPAPPPGRGGRGRFGTWVLEFDRTVPPVVEPLMGWTESVDPFTPIKLHFPDLQSAIGFAERQGWRYEVRDAPALARSAARYDLSNILARMQRISSPAAAKAWR